MAAFQNFRSALNGFNREDVVRYIEYTNNKHNSQINQFKTDIQTLQDEVAALSAKPAQDPEMAAQLEEALAARAALEQELESVRAELSAAKEALNCVKAVADRPKTDSELEAYRRAERAERVAGERVAQLYDQANGALADATVRTDEAATQISEAADRVAAQLVELQAALVQGKNTMKDAAAAMYAIRPVNPES